MAFEPLHTLLAGGRPAAAPVARRAGRPIGFGEFRAEAAAWRRAFAAHRGRCFALYFDDTLSFAAALFGLWHAGKTAYLPGDALPATLQRLRAHVDGFVGDLPDALQPLHDSAELPWQALDPTASQLVVFTSGSTGEPVAIAKRLDQVFAEVRALETAFGARCGRAEVLGTVSHQHIYGLLFRVLWPLASGRVFHTERLLYVEDVQSRLHAFGPAMLIASPAHLKRLPEVTLGPDLLALFSSGGPLPDAAVPECIARLGQAPIEVYGSSETGGVAWRQRGSAQATAAVWQALPEVQWRLSDELLEIRSPHLDTPDWTVTADRAAASASGFSLLGRADRVIKIEEKRVSLAAVEQALLATPWLQDLRVLSLPADVTGRREQLAVVAVPSDSGWALHEEIGKRAFAAHLRGQLLQGLDAVSAPRHWRFVSALPGNSQGKTTQDALLALFDPRRPQPRLLSAAPTEASLRIVIDASLPQFDGHFDRHPVLPGVVQLEWAILLARELFAELPPRFLGMEGIKFQRVIAPGQVLTLSLEFKPEAGKLGFRYASESGQHASGRILFGRAFVMTTPTTLGAVIPVYNHGEAVGAVVRAIRAHGLPVLLVDDGSEACCAAVLDALSAADADIHLQRLPINQGKGGAVMAGLRAARALGWSHALQIDADGQHDAGDVPKFAAAAAAHPGHFICGCPIYDASVPKARLYGRYATHVWVWINTLSMAIRDSMCGFRVYPLAVVVPLIDAVRIGRRMDFDVEVAVRLCWRGVPVINLPTRVSYPSDGISHFRALHDNVLISWMHTRLFFGMLARLPLLLWRKLA